MDKGQAFPYSEFVDLINQRGKNTNEIPVSHRPQNSMPVGEKKVLN